MAIDKEMVSSCINFIGKLVELISSCSNCVEIYPEYSLLRYPYIYLSVILVNCNDILEDCNRHLYDPILETTVIVDTIDKDALDFEKDMAILRVKCHDCWLEYGYTIVRTSSGMPYVSKGFTLICGGKKVVIDLEHKCVTDWLNRMMSLVIRRAKDIMESEGYI